jgi:hypothetical protein
MSSLQYKFNKNDEYYTPEYAIYPIMDRLQPKSTIWCPFDKYSSNFVTVLIKNEFRVLNTHIEYGQDFLTYTPPICDYIISNPPYSKKTEIFKRLYKIGKPFAMLMNVQGIFDSKERFELFQKNRVEIMYLYPRIDYIKQDSESLTGVPFQSAYVCSGILENQIEFDYINKEK